LGLAVPIPNMSVALAKPKKQLGLASIRPNNIWAWHWPTQQYLGMVSAKPIVTGFDTL